MSPPPVYGRLCTVTLRCLTLTQLHSPPTVESVGRPRRRPSCENIIETRVKNSNGTRARESTEGLRSKFSGVSQNIRRGRCSTVFPCIFLNPASPHPSPIQSQQHPPSLRSHGPTIQPIFLLCTNYIHFLSQSSANQGVGRGGRGHADSFYPRYTKPIHI